MLEIYIFSDNTFLNLELSTSHLLILSSVLLLHCISRLDSGLRCAVFFTRLQLKRIMLKCHLTF